MSDVRDQSGAYDALVDEVSATIKRISMRPHGADDGD